MSILGGPLLEEDDIENLLRSYPNFKGTLPQDARLWTEAELEIFLASGGYQRPSLGQGGYDAVDGKRQGAGPVCALLSKIRLRLAELKVDEATAEYTAYCRHRRLRSNFCSLPAVASCTPVQRAREIPEKLTSPVTVVPRRSRGGQEPAWKSWNLSFWKENFSLEWCKVTARWPRHEQDTKGLDALSMDAGLIEYLDYMATVETADGSCLEDQSLAFPRVQVGDFCPFTSSAAQGLFKQNWRDFTPPGVRDFTSRWCEIYGSIFEQEFEQQLAQFYRVAFSVPGAVSRLHRENHGAHAWLSQLEGQRLFFLFSPEDAAAGRLYEEEGGFDESFAEGSFGYATSISPVDVFFPSHKRHPLFEKADAQVCLLGEGKSLVIPAGWWWFSVATQPSVTLHHMYWGLENRLGFVDAMWAPFESKRVSAEMRCDLRPGFTELRDTIAADDGCRSLDECVIVDGGR